LLGGLEIYGLLGGCLVSRFDRGCELGRKITRSGIGCNSGSLAGIGIHVWLKRIRCAGKHICRRCTGSEQER